MKKYFLGTFAIVFAIGMSAFSTHKQTPQKKTFTNYIWFNVDPGSGSLSSLTDADVSFNSSLSSAPSSDPGCDGGTKNCVVGFNEDQVDATGQHLKSGSQPIQATYYTRTSN
jgi:hypothetical protein